MQADLFGCPLLGTPAAAEGAAFGAALLAGLGVGLWPDAASALAAQNPQIKQIPQQPAQLIFQKQFSFYKKLYKSLRYVLHESAQGPNP